MKFLLSIILLLCLQSYAQDDLTGVNGKLFHDSRPEANKPGIKSLFQAIEKTPFITSPKGMNIQENYIFYNGEGHNGKLNFSMLLLYKDDQGRIKANTDEPPTISMSLNRMKDLMDENSIFYDGQEFGKNLPIMFTDTLAVSYVDMNGYPVGQTVDTRFKNKKFILNPKRTAVFRAVTQEEYLKFFIASIQKTVTEDSLHQIEMKEQLAPLKNNLALKSTLDDLQKINEAMLKYIDFVKKKKQFYQENLAALSPSEKKATAYRVGHKDIAVPMKDGKPLAENISGHLEFEPGDENEDLIFKFPVLTFSESFLDSKLPKGAVQLLVIASPFLEDDVRYVNDPLKKLIEEKFFPLIAYKELATLMYR